MLPRDFIDQISEAAVQSMRATTVPASFVIAEAALESSWGESQLAKQAFNLFGVKADLSWHGDVLLMPTRECLNGSWVMVNARWRKYPDWLTGMGDHAAFLRSNPRYSAAFNAPDGASFARAVAAAGYATDPQYADKLCAIIDAHNLCLFDMQGGV